MDVMTKQTDGDKIALSRRGFLTVATVGAGAGALAPVLAPAPAQAAGSESKAAGYRETPHVLTAYDLARF